jgi:uncharacterized protein YgbK (DUF1537 family)
MHTALIISDDLTGATDTGQQFAVDGCRTIVTSWSPSGTTMSESEPETGTDVLVVDTDSRSGAETDAYETVASAIDTCPSKVVYKKIDSTLRGNVTSEVEAVLDHFDSDIAVVAPAFPSTGRVTVGGYHLVDGEPVSSVDDYQEYESPPSLSHLPTLLAKTGYPVEHVSIDVVTDGVDAIATKFDTAKTDQSTTLVVCDAVSETHLTAIATAAEQVGATAYVGSAGLAEHIELPDSASDRKRILGVVGSTNRRTIEQLSALPAEWIVELDTKSALDTPEKAGREAAQRITATMQSFNVAVVTSVRSVEDADRTYEIGQNRFELDESTVRTRIETALTTAVEECWTETSPDGLFATGGTIAKCVLQTLDADPIELTGQDVEDGIPVARFGGDTMESILLVTKAGGFGDRETIRNSLHTLLRL